MTPRRFATLAALCGTVFLAGWVIAEVAGLGMQGIKNTYKGLTEDRRAPPLGADADPVDAPKATAVGKVGIANVDAGTAAAETGTRGSGEAEAVEGALPHPSQMFPPKTPSPQQIATASTSGTAAAVARTVKEKSFDPSIIAKTIGDEASRLKNDAVEWGQKLQEFEADLKSSRNVDGTAKGVDGCLVVLRAAADRLTPNSETRATLRKQEDAIRDLAIRAEVHSNQAIRKIAGHFQQKTVELHVVNRSFEEMRTRLVTEIDRLQELKIRLQFNHTAAHSGELLKEGEVSIDNVQNSFSRCAAVSERSLRFWCDAPCNSLRASSGAGYEKESFVSRAWCWGGGGNFKCTGPDAFADLYRGSVSSGTAIGRSGDPAAGPRRCAAVGRSDHPADGRKSSTKRCTVRRLQPRSLTKIKKR